MGCEQKLDYMSVWLDLLPCHHYENKRPQGAYSFKRIAKYRVEAVSAKNYSYNLKYIHLKVTYRVKNMK